MEVEPLQAALVVAVFAVALLNTAVQPTGGLMLALVASLVPVPLAVPIHAAIEAPLSGLAWLAQRRRAVTQIVIAFSAGALVSIGFAAPFARVVPAHVQAILIGAFLFWACWWPAPDPGRRFPYRLPLAGAIIGACSAFVGATGGLTRPFIADEPIAAENVEPSVEACLAVKHLLKVVAFAVVGVAYGPHLLLVIAVVLAAIGGSLVGGRLNLRIPRPLFTLAIRLLVGLAALRLIAVGIGWM